ncbi:haloacid dehalogenase type II [Methylosinus sp. H3A]|uniref:haloacid dehalogenase type II n=1 Tax=Methylosinus sp. H3A TaxID=2785786 RepID=UPI0018C241FC|nr:haloacid dehalogenase type II [Methylosinus sp. H3A]MBG0808834.1 haloacid dehalogenase type II [Methylosinus sp. H3A]
MKFLRVFFFLLCAAPLGPARAEEPPTPRFKAVAFDYFVLFDPNSVIPAVEAAYPGKGAEFTKLWRAKQFEYCFLRSITDRHEDFFQVTDDALSYAAEAMKLDLPSETRKRLLNAYLTLAPWPDTLDALRRLKAAGVRIVTIANFSGKMLQANAAGAGLTGFFEELLSTEANKTYKPDPRAYALGMERLKLPKEDILFAAFGSWDAYGAKAFGYRTIWVDRFGLPAEKLGVAPDKISPDMKGLLELVLGRS